MTTLVTGASGRIGLPLVRRLIAEGHRVRALVMPDDPRAAAVREAGAEIIVGSIADEAACAGAVEGCDTIFHLAGQLPAGAADSTIFETNVRGTWSLMSAAADRADRVGLLVFASTDDVYSSQDPLYVPIDEGHPRRPVSTYGLSKVVGEEIGQFHRIRRGLPVAFARFGLTQLAHELLDGITAPFFLLSARVEALRQEAREDASLAPLLAELDGVLARDGERPIALRDAAGEPWILQICEVSDLVEGLLLYLDRPAAIGEAFNMGGPAPFATDVAAAHLAALTGLEPLDVRMPGPRVMIHESISKARSVLGYDPRLTVFELLDRAVAEVGRDRVRGT
jgi:UDP-glucose 4-epimerase